MPAPEFTPRSYFRAAEQHLRLEVRSREQGEHFAAHYFAGVTVESIWRALSLLDRDAFVGTHDLPHEDEALKAA